MAASHRSNVRLSTAAPGSHSAPSRSARPRRPTIGIRTGSGCRPLGRMEEQGVLSEAGAGKRGQKRYAAQAMMDAVTGDV